MRAEQTKLCALVIIGVNERGEKHFLAIEDGMLHMMFKLGMCAQENWRRLRGFNFLAQVITGGKFKDGIEVKAVNQAIA